MSGLRKRPSELEARTGKLVPMPYVWAQAHQTDEEARAAAGLTADAPNPIYRWRPAQ